MTKLLILARDRGRLRFLARQLTIASMTCPRPPIRIMTRLLAELQTSIISRGLTLVEGDIDRFAIFSLIVRESTRTGAALSGTSRPIPILSLSGSLSKPYETVRRQVQRLHVSGLCERRRGGVRLSADAFARPDFNEVLVHSHDAFVRFVDDFRFLGMPLPRARHQAPYQTVSGVAAAVDTMLCVLDTNRGAHAQWNRLVIFSAILAANVVRFARDPALSWRFADETSPIPRELTEPTTDRAVARLLGIAETTVRRHVQAMVVEQQLVRTSSGILVSDAWLNQPECVAVSRHSFQQVYRILERLSVLSFPYNRPADAYLVGRPANVWPRDGEKSGCPPINRVAGKTCGEPQRGKPIVYPSSG